MTRSEMDAVIRELLAHANLQVKDLDLHGSGQPTHTGASTIRVTGRKDEQPFSAIVKVLGRVAEWPSGTKKRLGTRPTDHDYWRRELEVYEAGILASLCGSLRAPRLLSELEPGDGTAWLLLEEIKGTPASEWSFHDFRIAARHLGEANAHFAADGSARRLRALNPHYLRSWVRSRRSCIRRIEGEEIWRLPGVQAHFPETTRPRLLLLWERRQALLAALETLAPRTLAHFDAHAGNLFRCSDASGNTWTGAIDWGRLGPAALGEELAALVTAPLFVQLDVDRAERLEGIALGGYLEGLARARCEVPEGSVRFAYAAHASLFWSFWVAHALRHLESPTRRRRVEQNFGSTYETYLSKVAQRTDFLLARGELAWALMPRVEKRPHSR